MHKQKIKNLANPVSHISEKVQRFLLSLSDLRNCLKANSQQFVKLTGFMLINNKNCSAIYSKQTYSVTFILCLSQKILDFLNKTSTLMENSCIFAKHTAMPAFDWLKFSLVKHLKLHVKVCNLTNVGRLCYKPSWLHIENAFDWLKSLPLDCKNSKISCFWT